MLALWLRRAVVLVLIAAIAATGGAAAAAKERNPDYQGTYAGAVRTNTGRQVPVTLFIRDEGNTAALTASAMGYTVRLYGTENWVDGSTVKMRIVPAPRYSSILSGVGTLTLTKGDKRWTAIGSGSGTALVRFSGSAKGAAVMVSRAFDAEKADAWHAANPVPATTAPPKRPKVVVTAERVTAPVAAQRQAPLPDPEKLLTNALIGLLIAVALLSGLMFGWFKKATPAVRQLLRAMRDDRRGGSAQEGGQ